MEAVYKTAATMELSPKLAETHHYLLAFFQYQLECSSDLDSGCSAALGMELFNQWAGPVRYLAEY